MLLKLSHVAWDVAITSMLTTMGSCCVVGKSEEHINGVMHYNAMHAYLHQNIDCF